MNGLAICSEEIVTINHSESWRAKNNWRWSMLQELERVNYSWGRAIELAKNCVHWRVLMDALCSPGGD